MDEEWYEAAITAILWAPPSLFGVRALIGKPFRMGKNVVSRRMSLCAAAIWLAPLPITLVITYVLLYVRHPRPEEMNRIVREFTPFALRLMSFLCFLSGGIVAFAGSTPEPKPKVKKKGPRNRKGKRSGRAG